MGDIYKFGVEFLLFATATLLFAQEFNIHFGLISPRPMWGLVLVAPKGPGQSLAP